MYVLSTTFRFTFSVGVSSPRSIEKSCSSRAIFFGISNRANPPSWPNTSFSILARIAGISSSCRRSVHMKFLIFAYFSSCSQFGTMSTLGNLRLSPIMTAWLTYLLVLMRFSIGCGATFLPPAVTMRSFLRSVIERKSSRSSPMSPVWNQPSASMASRVASGLL